ncbi:MAG: putative bifunctional diguanylate cyclase/phosphodiesterase [Clostridia bacterium]
MNQTIQVVTDAVLAQTIFEQTIESIMITDKFGVIRRINPAFTATTGYSPAEVVGKTPRVLNSKTHDAAFFQNFWMHIKTTGYWHGEIWNRKKNGEVYLENLRVAPYKENGQITGYIAIFTDITAHRLFEQKMEHQLLHDPLTGLANRIQFLEKISGAVERANSNKSMAAVICLDLNNFKSINESMGTAFGDIVLQHIGLQLVSRAGTDNLVARLGGDEFAILLPEIEDEAAVQLLVEKIMTLFEQTISVDGHEFFLTTSVGISLYPVDGNDPDELMKHADSAMYRAMELGGSSFEFYTDDMNKAAHAQVQLGSNLSKALERGELIVSYQPQLSLATNRFIGMEALIRWRHPEQGLISPASFIPIAEETGLIVPIGEWILRTACHQTKEWQEKGYGELRVAVNLSARQFQQEDLVEMVTKVLQETSLEAKYLELEITESIAMNDVNRVIDTLHRLKKLGVRLAIDDFGTGYSSLSYLTRFPITNLKIDRSFINNVATVEEDAAIAKTIISLGKALNLQVTAEGVETKEQLDFLRKLECNKIQGYYISKPLFADEFENLIATQSQTRE